MWKLMPHLGVEPSIKSIHYIMLKAVLFDMDGVIVDSEPLHRKAYQKMFADYKPEVLLK